MNTANLTPREQQVCDLLVMGMSNKEIAIDLGISPRTVEDFRPIIFRKYNVHSAAHLIRAVYGLGAPPARKTINA